MSAPRTTADGPGVLLFFVLACAFTWGASAPVVLAWTRQQEPSGWAIAGAGLSAFGPSVAALVMAGPRGQLVEVFGRWRTRVGWIVLALAVPLGVRVLAVALYALAGGEPSRWLYLPVLPTQVAALVVFPLGEELGWRGYAHPRVVSRFGWVGGSLLLGAVWGVWHLLYCFPPDGSGFDWFAFVQGMVELPLYSVVLAWIFERADRSLAVAIAFHATAHVDHIELAPRSELGLHVIHVALVFGLACLARYADSRWRHAAKEVSTRISPSS